MITEEKAVMNTKQILTFIFIVFLLLFMNGCSDMYNYKMYTYKTDGNVSSEKIHKPNRAFPTKYNVGDTLYYYKSADTLEYTIVTNRYKLNYYIK